MKVPIWQPSEERKRNANITRFMDFVNGRHDLEITAYHQLHDWSITRLSEFWQDTWDFLETRASKPCDTVVQIGEPMYKTRWFLGACLNFAENLLRYRDGRTALIFKGEGREPVRITYGELFRQVAGLVNSLRGVGVQAGDRVVGFMPNMIETVSAMLATAGLGAVWSSCSPDFGIKGALDRFGQIRPKVLFTADGYSYNGRVFDSLERVASIVKAIPSIEKVVVVPYMEREPDISRVPRSVTWGEFLKAECDPGIDFAQLPADHPLYIMYSSGTTGLPKCIVQGAAGVLLGQVKELKLNIDIKREDTVFYATTCGWMMWNWLVSSLALGATVVLYDGSPFYPDPGALFRLAQDEKITVFGTSARYLASLEKAGIKPAEKYDLTDLKSVLSTGSPLSVESYNYVYRHIKRDLLLASISGGTDINGCFLSANPVGPVYAGELQCQGLGMNVQAFNSAGKPVINQKGELVCLNPYPSMPLYFWNDQNNKKYHDAYFGVYPNIWRHGDYVVMTENGGAIIFGRSDATINPGGVRIGTAEIYGVVERFSEIRDSLAVGQKWNGDERIILFVKLADGVSLSQALTEKIKDAIRQNLSPRHVPARVIAVGDIPCTKSGKKVEIAVRKIIHGEPVLNTEALANPESLTYYQGISVLRS